MKWIISVCALSFLRACLKADELAPHAQYLLDACFDKHGMIREVR